MARALAQSRRFRATKPACPILILSSAKGRRVEYHKTFNASLVIPTEAKRSGGICCSPGATYLEEMWDATKASPASAIAAGNCS
jgi:hypothetical protein